MSFKGYILIVILLLLQGCSSKSKEQLYQEGVERLKAKDPGAAVVLLKSALEKDQNYLDARYQLAKAFVAQHKYEQAEKEFLKVLALNPSRDEVHLDLARLYTKTKREDEAFKLAESYLVKHPNNAESYEVMGLARAGRGEYQEAEGYLIKATQADRGNQAFRLELASIYLAQKQNQKTRELLQQVIKDDAQNTRAYYMLAALDQIEGNIDGALATYKKITGFNRSETLASYREGLIYISRKELDKADALAATLVSEFPKRADGYRLKGMVQYYRKQYADAVASIQNSIKIAPSLDGYYYLGLCDYSLGEFENALSNFRKVLDYAPASRQASLMTATVLMAQKRTDDAITELTKLLKQHENDAEAYNLLGSAYMAKGMFEEGLRALNNATRINPQSANAHLKKGRYYLATGKVTEGEAELFTAVQVAPDQLVSRLLLASAYLRSNKPAKALELLKAGLRGSASDAPLYSGMATILFLENRQEEGIRSLQRAKELAPTFAPAYQRLAAIYAASGKYDQAIREYQTLLQRSPDNLQAMLQLAALYEAAGNDAEALAQYERAKATKKTAAYLAEAQYYLKKHAPSKAQQVLEDGLKIDHSNPQLYDLLARVLADQKKFKDALKQADDLEAINADAGITLKMQLYLMMQDRDKSLAQARRIVERHPTSARGYLLVASVYEFYKNYGAAISETRKAVQLTPKDPQVLLYLGNLQAANKDYDAAFAAYHEILKQRQFPPALYAEGALLQRLGKKGEAVAKYRAALAPSDQYVPALNNLSYLCSEGFCGKHEALSLAMKAYRLEPSNAGVMDTLGYALFVNGKYGDARKVLEKASSLIPNQPTVLYHLGLLYKQTGNKVAAVKAFNKALALGPFSEAETARRLSNELAR